MSNLGYAVFFLSAAACGILWSLKPSADLGSRISPEIVYRLGAKKWLTTRFRFGINFDWFRPKRPRQVSLDASDLASVLGLGLHNGESPLGVLDWVSQRLKGQLGRRLRQAVLAIRTGSSLSVELSALAKESKYAEYAETLDRLARAAQLGTDVSSQVQVLAETANSAHRVQLLAKQSRTELRMLLPLVFLILPTTILFAVYPSLQMLQLMEF